MEYFICEIKLKRILAFALRTLVGAHVLCRRRRKMTLGRSQYSINKSKTLLGFVGPNWEQHVVRQLDADLQQWRAVVPPHRQWHRFDASSFN